MYNGLLVVHADDEVDHQNEDSQLDLSQLQSAEFAQILE